jgi:hypothetical protein
VRNPYFEPVPFALLTLLIAADERYAPEQVRAALTQWQLHPWLAGG